MSGLFSITVEEARGFVAAQADLDKLAVVIGCSSVGTKLSSFFLSGVAAVTARGYGDAVNALTQIIEQRQSDGSAGIKFPAAIYTTPVDTAGSYGAIDNSGVTGSGLFAVDATSAPLGTYEARIKVITAFTIGVAGGAIQWSLDAGRNYSNTTAVGTADSFTIPNSGVKFVFTPSVTDLTALNTLINEEKTKLTAHVVLTTGTVHSNADNNASVVAMNATASATSTATRIARVNAIKAAYNAHRILGSGASPAIHINVSGDATNIVTGADATDDESALSLALEIKTKANAHMAGTTWHTIADATNPITSAAPSADGFVAGDVGAVRTLGPQPSTSSVDTAFTDLAKATADFSIVVCEFPADATMITHLTTGLNALAAAGKRCIVLARTRVPDFEGSETEQDWVDDMGEDFGASVDSRIVLRATYGLITDAMTTRQYLRSDLAQFAADVVRIDLEKVPDVPADRPMANVILTDASGALVGHDEGSLGNVTGLSNPTLGNRLSSVQRLADPQRRNAVFNTVPWVLYAADERIRNLPVRRIANAMERDAVSAGTSTLGQTLFYNLADPNVPGSTPTLTEASRNAIHAVIFGALSVNYADKIQNANDADGDTGLVQVASAITVSGGNLVSVSVTVAPRVFGILLNLDITLSIQE